MIMEGVVFSVVQISRDFFWAICLLLRDCPLPIWNRKCRNIFLINAEIWNGRDDKFPLSSVYCVKLQYTNQNAEAYCITSSSVIGTRITATSVLWSVRPAPAVNDEQVYKLQTWFYLIWLIMSCSMNIIILLYSGLAQVVRRPIYPSCRSTAVLWPLTP
jgi:hypothetical protein